MILGMIEKDFFSIGDKVGRKLIIFGVNMRYFNSWERSYTMIRTFTCCRNIVFTLTKENTNFCLSSHYSRANCYLFINNTELIKLNAKIPKLQNKPGA